MEIDGSATIQMRLWQPYASPNTTKSHGKGNVRLTKKTFPAIFNSYQRGKGAEIRNGSLEKLNSGVVQTSRIELDGNEWVGKINKHPTQSSNHPDADVAALLEPKYPKILLLPTISVMKQKKKYPGEGKTSREEEQKAERGEGEAGGITHQYQSSRW